jgi:general secretion pathway protein A
VPRRINLLCDRALLGAFATSRPTVDRATLDKAAGEVFGPAAPSWSWNRRTAGALGLGLVAGAGLLAAVTRVMDEPPVPRLALEPPARAASAPARSTSASVAAVAPPMRVASAAAPALLRDANAAWRELAQAWKAEPFEGDPCRALAKQQLQCFSRTLNLALIRELGRPGIVTLDAGSVAPSYAVLTALTPTSATLRAAGTEQTVTLGALASRWQGDFSTVWRTPPGWGRRDAETVDWMATQLAKDAGVSPPAGRPAMNAQLRSQLRAFQLAHGLPPDGQPGPMTFMQLNRVAGVEEPRLRTEP